MKKSTKTVLIIGGCLIGGGMLLTLCGWVTGGRSALVYRGGAWQPAGYVGSTWNNKTLREEQTFAGVQSLELSVSLGEVSLREDKGLEAGAVRVNYALPENMAPRITNEQGELSFDSQGTLMENDGWYYGWPSFFGRRNRSPEAYVNVYYGPGTAFGTLALHMSMGNLSVADIQARDLLVENDMGEVDLRSVHIQETADITLSTGNLTVIGCDLGQPALICSMGNIDCRGLGAKNLTATASMGEIDLDGTLAGDTKLDCDMGSIELTTDLPRSAYDLDLKASMGSVSVEGDDEDQHVQEHNPGAAHSIEGRCSMGSIDVFFSGR